MYGFTKGYRLITILTPVLVFVDVIIQLQIPKLMGKIIDTIYTFGDADFSHSTINRRLFEMLGLCLLTLIIGYVASRFSAIASMGFGANLRSALFNKVQDLSFENIDRIKISSLVTRMTGDTSMIQSMFSSAIVTFIKGPYLLVMALIYSIQISPKLSQIFYVAVPAILVSLIFMGVVVVPMFKQMLEKTDEFNDTVRGNVNGIRVVKSFVREEFEKEKFEKVNLAVAKANIRAEGFILFVTPALMMIIYACMIITLYRGSRLIIFPTQADGLTTGELSAFVSYISEVISSLLTILLVFISMAMARASVKRVGEVFNEVSAVSDADADKNLLVKDGSIEFKNVTFKYSGSAENNLENINLKINSGETIGIIGATGSSKSTLVQLIPRLYEATQGEVLVGGKNVKEYTFEHLRNEISMVLQNSILFTGTIKDNIRWGKVDATDEEIEHVAKLAQAHDFILEKENGYDAKLYHGGNTVSGGERQRICIARALLKKPKILILDDSTSAVDTATDSRLKHALRSEEFNGITKIIIAQRITSIMDSDRIIVIDNGKINGVGTHDELVESNEIYKEIFISQQEGVLAQ